MTVFAKVIVSEQDGIRRFQYPLAVDIPFKKNETLEIAVRDSVGNLLPSESYRSRNRVIVHFVISLEPYERRKLTVFKSEHKAPVLDPIKSEHLEDGTIISRQERFTTTLNYSADLSSVQCDGTEHLAAPVTFTLNAEQSEIDNLQRSSRGRELSLQATTKRYYHANERAGQTITRLMAGKPWVEFTHCIDEPVPGSIVSMEIPLVPPGDDDQPTCDFGLGSGVYCKIDGDAVLLEGDFYGKKPFCCWQISRLSEGIQRIDFQGDAVTTKSLSRSLYFHWVLPNRSLAVVITQLPSSCSHIQAIIGRNGTIRLSAVLGEVPIRKAVIRVLLQFINDLPAAAAATTPASIASSPVVTFKM